MTLITCLEEKHEWHSDFIHLNKPKLSIFDSFFSWNFLTLAKKPIVLFVCFLILSKYALNILTNVFVFSSMCGSLARISLEHLGCGQRHSLGSFDFCQQLLPRSAHWFTQEPWINHLKPDQNVNFWYTGARPCLCVYIDQTAGEKTKKERKRKGILWDVEKRVEDSVVASWAEGQTGRPSNRTKHRPRDGLKMLKGWEQQRFTGCKDYLPQRPWAWPLCSLAVWATLQGESFLF